MENSDLTIIASAGPLGTKGATALSVCKLAVGDMVIGSGTIRSFYVPSTGQSVDAAPELLHKYSATSLAGLMSVRSAESVDERFVLRQLVDPGLNNPLGVVHGGVASAGLELAASAAINASAVNVSATESLQTASVRVNFLRPFIAGERSRYVANPLRVGRRSAVCDAEAIGDDGRAALVARITAYR